jgi:magnesium-transporting ATPase (P-type)
LCTPQYLIVETLRELGYSVGATGDGVNDAPALKRADVGIAVKGSTDAAIAAADIILTEDGLGTIIYGIIIAREIFSRISNFITYRVRAIFSRVCIDLAHAVLPQSLFASNGRFRRHFNYFGSSSLPFLLSIHPISNPKTLKTNGPSFSTCQF